MCVWLKLDGCWINNLEFIYDNDYCNNYIYSTGFYILSADTKVKQKYVENLTFLRSEHKEGEAHTLRRFNNLVKSRNENRLQNC